MRGLWVERRFGARSEECGQGDRFCEEGKPVGNMNS